MKRVGMLLAVGVALLLAACSSGSQATLNWQGGPVLRQVNFTLVFWGSAWSAANEPTEQAAVEAANGSLDPGYTAKLAQYGVSGGQVVGSVEDLSSDPQDGYTTAMVGNFLKAELNAGKLDGKTAYMVAVAPSALPGEHHSGAHGWFPWGGRSIYYGWLEGGQGPRPFAYTFSHEAVEMMTDPQQNGWLATGSVCPYGDSTCEIADICAGEPAWDLGAVAVTGYWSESDRRCVAPGGVQQAPPS